ncbi:hypothetical protein [Rhizorhapis sp. SPR117]|uniref:hypothetical protein n=1 Tax=Rhizorhapis sp. SPR117 TaxID=2912611 RepID=UPI001F3CAE96|nr:hypothetical protein [Rhizorhapis sp. SPR117]
MPLPGHFSATINTQDTLKNYDDTDGWFDRIAFLTASMLHRAQINRIVDPERVRFFDSEADAAQWLAEGRQD